MTTVYTAVVFCDRCGTWDENTQVSGPKLSSLATRAVKLAKKAGWSRDTKSMDLDLCPSCLSEARKGAHHG